MNDEQIHTRTLEIIEELRSYGVKNPRECRGLGAASAIFSALICDTALLVPEKSQKNFICAGIKKIQKIVLEDFEEIKEMRLDLEKKSHTGE